MSRPRALFLSPRPPYPPNKGDKIRTSQVFSLLAESCDIHCASFVESRLEAADAAVVHEQCVDSVSISRGRLAGLFRGGVHQLCGGTVTLGAYASAELMARIKAWSRERRFDVVYAFGGAMAPYALAADADYRVLDLCDADSQKWLDYATERAGAWWNVLERLLNSVHAREGARLRSLERNWLSLFDAVTVITQREADTLDPQGECQRLHVVSNAGSIMDSAPQPSHSRPVVSFIGALDYRPNVEGVLWFVQNVWPVVLRLAPAARLQIVGRNPVGAVRRLHGACDIQVMADVPSVMPYLLSSRVAIAPMRQSRGLPNKVLEAMGAGRPVVATSAVGASLEAHAGVELIVADDAAVFAQAVGLLLRDDAWCDRVGECGREYVRRRHGRSEIHAAWRRLLLNCAETVRNPDASVLASPITGQPFSEERPRRVAGVLQAV